MEESILTSVKKMLGITKEYDAFDMDIVMHINSVFMILYQRGVGTSDAFRITDDSAKWNAFIQEGSKLESVKSYVYLKVKLLFDPPTNSAVAEANNRMISDLEWRLNFEVES